MKESNNQPKKHSYDIVDLILEDHKPLKELIKILKDEHADAGERLVAFEKFAPLLTAHSKPEEQSLYVFMKNDEELIVEGLECETEHGIAENLVSEIYATTDENLWSAKVKVLAELVEHHIKEEENTILPDLQKNTEQSDRFDIGARFIKFKEQIMEENFKSVGPESDSVSAL